MAASAKLLEEALADEELPPALKSAGRAKSQIRAAVLTRLSRLTDETTSPERQRLDCVNVIERNGWTFDPAHDVYEDLDRSGWSEGAKRPGLDRLVANLDSYDVIVFWKLDRTFRSLRRFITFVDQCEAAGVGMMSVQERHIDTTTPWGRFVAYLFMLLAQLEGDTISVRQKSAQAYLADHGYWGGGPAPFGWRIERLTDGHARLQLHPDNAESLRQVVDDVLAGTSLTAAARWLNDGRWVVLNADGKPRKNPGRCRANNLGQLLRNPVLLGHQIHQGEVVTDATGTPLQAHEPLIDLWTWTRLQDRLAAITGNSIMSRRRSSNETLLRGLTRCSTCGARLIANPHTYGCPTRQSDPDACVPVWINRPGLEEFVTGAVLARLTPDRLAEARALLDQEQQLLGAPDPAAGRRAELTQQLERLEEDRRDGLYDAPAARTRFRSQHAALVDELDRLAPPPALTPGLDIVAGADEQNTLERWDDLTVSERRTIIGAVVDHIEISPRGDGPKRFNPDRIRIVWADGADPAEPVAP